MKSRPARVEAIPVDGVVWDPSVYPRAKWNTSTIERYAEALRAGAEFPPIVIDADTGLLLDGKHRLEAHRKAGVEEIAAERRTVPEGMSAKYYAATLSASHGDRMSYSDLKALAVEEFTADPTRDVEEWAKELGVQVACINKAACKGCGTCVAWCPTGAIVGRHFTDEQIDTILETLLEWETA